MNKNPAYRRNRLISYDAVASVYEERICQLNQGGEKTSDIGARESRVLSLKSVKARIENRMAETKKEIKKKDKTQVTRMASVFVASPPVGAWAIRPEL